MLVVTAPHSGSYSQLHVDGMQLGSSSGLINADWWQTGLDYWRPDSSGHLKWYFCAWQFAWNNQNQWCRRPLPLTTYFPQMSCLSPHATQEPQVEWTSYRKTVCPKRKGSKKSAGKLWGFLDPSSGRCARPVWLYSIGWKEAAKTQWGKERTGS